MEYKTYWKVEELPDNGIVFARLSDDVLDNEDWDTYKLILKDGVVTEVTVECEGAYNNIDDRILVGMTKSELVEWQYKSSPSTHPGFFKELAKFILETNLK